MKTTCKKRFKRLLGDLDFMRRDIMTKREEPDHGKRVILIEHIDAVIKSINKRLSEAEK